jgi:hypothetical protein
MFTILKADWSPTLRSIAHHIAAAVVAVYVVGFTLGVFIHSANDALAGIKPTPSRPVLQYQQATRVANVLPTITAPPLASLTVIELRKLARQAGHKSLARSGRKADLLAMLTRP